MEKLAILGGQPAKTKDFPAWPQYDEKEEKALMEVLHSGVWWRTPGRRQLNLSKNLQIINRPNLALPAQTAQPLWK